MHNLDMTVHKGPYKTVTFSAQTSNLQNIIVHNLFYSNM